MKYFRKDLRIRVKSGWHNCIIANKEIAVFAPSNKRGTKIRFRNIFVVNSEIDAALNDGLEIKAMAE